MLLLSEKSITVTAWSIGKFFVKSDADSQRETSVLRKSQAILPH